MTDWEKLNTHDLKARLKTELATDAPDRKLVIGILEELKKRDPVKEIPIEAVAQWDKIRTRKKPKSNRWKPVWKAAVAAVLAVTLLGIVPTALGMENIFEAVSRWTKDVFYFGDKESKEFAFQTDHPGLQELYDTVSELGITKNVVPTWLPDGFETKSIEKKSSPKGIVVYSTFTNGKRDIQVSVSVCNENRVVDYQKDDGTVEVLECDGVKTYIVTNNGECCAMWQTENIECAIFSDKKEEIYKMIDSIYRREKT